MKALCLNQETEGFFVLKMGGSEFMPRSQFQETHSLSLITLPYSY